MNMKLKDGLNKLGTYIGIGMSNYKIKRKHRQRQGLISKSLSIFLIATLIFTSSNLQGVRAEVGSTNSSLETTESKEYINKDPAAEEAPIISEIVEKRTLNTKTFMHSDYTMTTSTYPANIFYEEAGKLKEIDNSLVLKGDEYSNKDNSFKITFASDVLKENLMKIRENGYGIDFSLKESAKDEINTLSKAEKKELKSEIVQEKGLSKVESDNAKKTDVENIGSGVIYRDVKTGIDLEYLIQGASVKENIYIKEKVADPSLTFELNVTGLTIGINVIGNIELKDQKTGKSVYEIPKPFMFDANNESTDKVAFILEKTSESKATIKYIPDSEWLNAKGRSYPVIVDPPVFSSNHINDIKDTFVDQNDSEDKWQNMYLRAGRNSNGGLRRSFVKVQLPTIGSGDVVIESLMLLYAEGSQTVGTNTVFVHKNSSPMPSATYAGTLWNNQQTCVATTEDYKMVNAGTSGWVSFDITQTAKDWYLNGNNYGISLRADGSATGHNAVFWSSDTSYSTIRPTMLVRYVNSTGIEGHQTYHTQDAGRGGTVYVNDYTGDMTIERPIMVEKGEINPLSITAYFNGNYKDVNKLLGYGWGLNISQYISWKDRLLFADGIGRMLYQDADGTQHYYIQNPNGEFRDEDSSTDTVMTNGGPIMYYYDMKDKNNNHLYFDTIGRLTRIMDKNSNRIDISYDVSSRPTTAVATNASGQNLTTTTFTYNPTNGRLGSITDSRGKNYYFNYTGAGMLDNITDPDGNFGKYLYDGNRLPSWVYGNTGGYYRYTYTGNAPYRVAKVFERPNDTAFNTGTEPGMGITYGHNTTTFTDFDGKINVYQYNNLGQCTGIVDNDGNAIFNDYGSVGNQNNLKSQSGVQTHINNYVLNGNFERGVNEWIYSNGLAGNTGTGQVESTYKYMGSNSYKLEKTNATDRSYVNQWIALEKSKEYTLSGYIKTDNLAAGSKASIQVVYGNLSSSSPLRSVSDYALGTSDWTRYQTTFTIPADATSNKVFVELSLEGGAGIAYFDCIQLEDGKTANRFNLIEDSSFSRGLELFSTAGTASIAPYSIGRTGAGIAVQGNPSGEGKIYQEINVSGLKDDSYVFGGWARGLSVPVPIKAADGNRRFTLEVQMFYLDAVGQLQSEWIAYKSFNDAFEANQYISIPVVATRNYTKLRVYMSYSFNANSAVFDDMHLFKDEFGSSYTYDANGNVISVKDKAKEESTFTYTGDNLKDVTNPNGGKYEYTYDGKKNLLSAKTATGIEYHYEYNSVGRSFKNTIQNSTGTLSILSSVTYNAVNSNFTETKTDSKGYTTTNSWDTTQGRVTAVTDNAGGEVKYGYDSSGRLNKTTSDMNATEEVVNESVFISDKLSQILHNGFSYNFEYDSFGMMLKTKVGSVDLVTNEYNNNTHMLIKSTYGNGTVFEPVYDSDYQLIGKKYGGSMAYEYVYSDQGELTTVRDIVNANTTNFLYDLSGRLVKTTDTSSNKWVFGYDTHSNMNSIDKTQFGVQEKESITFDLDNKVKNFELRQGTTSKIYQTIEYDAIGRILGIETKRDSEDTTALMEKNYEYKKVTIDASTTSDTTLVSKEESSYLEKDYTYDLKGNITSITVGGNTISYTYDLIGQLLTEDNEVTGEYIVYDYDTGGNIQTKTVTLNGGTPVVYNYGYDSVWRDKLVSFDGKSLTYDAIGNSLTIGDSVLTWIQGRKLATFKKDATSDTATYTYDENGIRKTKTVGDEVIEYITGGGEIFAQKSNNGTPSDSSDDVVITYTRGADGSLVSMNRNGIIYYYVTNIQGDVEQILGTNGQVVVSYVYDAYGRVVDVSGSLASTLGEENPFRYRSYYFDIESGYYYLQSRYFDPLMGRFISADSQINPEVNGGNVFTYASNNPVNQTDPDGHFSREQIFKAISNTIKVINTIIKIKRAYDDVKSSVINGAKATIDDVKSKVVSGTKATIKRINSSKIASDLKRFDLFNTDPQVVIDANIISAYKGSLVIKSSFLGTAAFSHGAIFIGDKVKDYDTINHEYGHIVQLRHMGTINYNRFIFVPSVIFHHLDIPEKLGFDYYSTPWEYQAELYGGVERGTYESWAEKVNIFYPK